MNDFERRIADALKEATSDYRPGDPYEAKATFLTRMRRRRIAWVTGSAVLAGATTALALFLLPQDVGPREEEPLPAAAPPEIERTIAVGSEPSGLAFGDGRLWVATAGGGTVRAIDPASNTIAETYEVGGTPDDVAVGYGATWVTDSQNGTVTKISDGGDLIAGGIAVGEPGNHLDIASGADAIWIVSAGDSLYRIDPTTNVVEPIPSVESPTDVSASEDLVMVLGATELVALDPASGEITPVSTVAESRNQDLQISSGAVWVANGDTGEVTRFDIATGEASEPVYVGGNFTAIASGEAVMWTISGDDGDYGVLTRIDPVTTEIVGERARLGGRPFDVTTGAGSVWVANYGPGSVARLDPENLPSE